MSMPLTSIITEFLWYRLLSSLTRQGRANSLVQAIGHGHERTQTTNYQMELPHREMERPEIAELFYFALMNPNDVEQLFPFLAPRVEWILSAANPQTLGDEIPPNSIQFSGKAGLRQLALYFRDSLKVISGDLTGCIPHHHLVFSFGRVRLQTPGMDQPAETNLAARITFQGLTITRVQIRISWPLVF